MSIATTEQVLFLNSANASYKSLTTGQCQFNFNPQLRFSNKKYRIAVQKMSFTNFFINIITGTNDLIYYTNDLLNLTKYSITIPQGSYNVSDLSDAINIGVINNGHTDGLITLTPDFSSNKVLVSISAAGWLVKWAAQTSYSLNGFALNATTPAVGTLTVGAYSELAPGIATYNAITEIYVKSSITYNSCFGGKSSNIIFSTSPTAPIGSVQNTEYNNLVWIYAPELSGQAISTLNIDIVNQNEQPIILSDDFAITILIESY